LPVAARRQNRIDRLGALYRELIVKPWPTRLASIVAAFAVLSAGCSGHPQQQEQTFPPGLPVRDVGQMPLPGDNSRFDSASLDTDKGLLYISHIAENELIQVDVNAQRVVRTIPNLTSVHGVLAVGELNRVFANATRTKQVVAIDETTGAEIGRAPTGEYPVALAYDSKRRTIWVSNEKDGTATVIDANTLQSKGVPYLGAEVGDAGYYQTGDRIVVALPAANQLAVVDPNTMTIVTRVALPDCDYSRTLAVDDGDGLVFVACAYNAHLITVDATNWTVVGTDPVGQGPDILAYDTVAHRLYVAAESGILTVAFVEDRRIARTRAGFLADDAHVVAVDPKTHRSYFPVHGGPEGPALLIREAT
jgi:DNA-binding beta-propeller fold protein YncE